MKIISWNVNGLRACVTKGFVEFFKEVQADIFCVQETKLQSGQIELELEGYHQYWNYADKKGYSGTAVFTKEEPLQVMYGMGIDEHDHEGRLITLEFEDFYLINGYIPNAQSELKRIDYRMKWEDDFRNYICGLDQKKPVVFCGDLNVAHQEIDLKNPRSNRQNPGFSDEERAKFSQLLSAGFTDTFRFLYPDLAGAYSWWSYMNNSRQNNVGWRIDYFLASRALRQRLEDALIYTQVQGSDHCPVGLILRDVTG